MFTFVDVFSFVNFDFESGSGLLKDPDPQDCGNRSLIWRAVLQVILTDNIPDLAFKAVLRIQTIFHRIRSSKFRIRILLESDLISENFFFFFL